MQIVIAGVTGSNGRPVVVTITGITQDEPIDGIGDGRTCPDAGGVGTETAVVRAERAVTGDGRVYHIAFHAEADQAGPCEGSVTVCVPAGVSRSCADEGGLFDSTGPLCTNPCGQVCMMERTLAGAACGEERLPTNVRLRLDSARRALRAALRSRTMTRVTRLLARAKKLVDVAGGLTGDAESAGEISQSCAAEVLDAVAQFDELAQL